MPRTIPYTLSRRNKLCLYPNYSKGFTLLELLIVLAIIGIMIGIGIASFSSAQVRARDSRRKSDLKIIASALENYFQKNKAYPVSSSGSCPAGVGWFCSNSEAAPWIPQLGPTYTKNLPKDLRNTPGPICNPRENAADNADAAFTYGYHSSTDQAGTEYILSAKLENQNDPDLGKPIRFGNQTYSNYGCFAITSP